MNKYNPKIFFTEEEKIKIEETVKSTEKKTSGEIVVAVVKESSGYSRQSNFTAVFFSILFSLLILYFIPEILLNIFKLKEETVAPFIKIPFGVKEELRFFLTGGVWIFIAFEILIYLLVKLLFRFIPAFKALFLSGNLKADKVKKRAVKTFYEKRLFRTRDMTGVLFLFSLLEKKIYILADKGIYEKITQETLDRYAKEISDGVKTKGKSNAEALIASIKDLGLILEKNFPIKPDDTNELSNKVITE
jgi:putative membrane protein